MKKGSRYGEMDLCDDIMIEIMKRLPTKSLFRFQCVSQQWNSLISYAFSERKLVESRIRYGIYIQPRDDRSYFLYPRFRESLDEVGISITISPFLRVIDISNGLMLLSPQNEIDSIFVCNLLLKKWMDLPPPPLNETPLPYFFSLVFEPPHFQVIIFLDPTTHSSPNPTHLHLQIYSSRTAHWVQSTLYIDSPTPFKYVLDRRAVFLNGALHFLSHPRHILILDLKLMRSRIIELPGELEPLHHHPVVECFGESKGRLYFAYKNVDSEIQIWVLDDYYGVEWVLRDTISYPPPNPELTGTREGICSFAFLIFSPKHEQIFFWVNSWVVSYDLSSRSWRRAVCLSMDATSYLCAYPFSPTLCSFNKQKLGFQGSLKLRMQPKEMTRVRDLTYSSRSDTSQLQTQEKIHDESCSH